MADVVDISEGTRRKGRKGKPKRSKSALVLTGGGVVGGVYQIGALRALDLIGEDFGINDFDMYVGTSCGAFVSSLVANGARPGDLMRVLDGEEVTGFEPIELNRLLKFSWGDLSKKAIKLPRETLGAMRDIALNARSNNIVDAATRLADLVPASFYTLDGLVDMLGKQLRQDGYTDDFRKLSKELYIVATDLDTVEPVLFGHGAWDNVPIAKAVAASSALPMVYRGVEIRGREFVDGGLRAFANIEAAIAGGAELVVIVNPIVPYVNDRLRVTASGKKPPRLSELGMTAVASQTFKTLVWGAMHDSVNHFRDRYPDVDIVLIEPQPDDRVMFDTHIFNISQTVHVARHGFESVTTQLGSDFDQYREICARHGISISRRRVIETLREHRGAASGTSRWKEILEEDSGSA